MRAEVRAAGRPEPPLDEVVWKPDAFATTVWERRYLGPALRASGPRGPELLPRRDLYLLTSHEGVPFEQDGLRDGEHIRADMTGWFVEAMTGAGHSWVLLTGSREERMRLAVRCVDQALERRMRFAEPLS